MTMEAIDQVARRTHSSEAIRARIEATRPPVLLRRLGEVDYAATWEEMKRFTSARSAGDADQLWLLQHPPVYTLGLAGRRSHLLRSDTCIPVIQSDRGGQITYHGPGQIVAYTLVDLRRLGIGVRQLVWLLEQSVIDLLAAYGVEADRRTKAPGVYIGEAKVAALGLRIRNGCSYHGLSLNADMDLAPFDDIDPCGHPGLRVTQLRDFGIGDEIDTLGDRLAARLQANLWPDHSTADSSTADLSNPDNSNTNTPDTENR